MLDYNVLLLHILFAKLQSFVFSSYEICKNEMYNSDIMSFVSVNFMSVVT